MNKIIFGKNINFCQVTIENEFNHLSFPITEKIHEEILSLPLYPYLEKNHIDKIVEAVSIFKD